jgi:hypothetical protein
MLCELGVLSLRPLRLMLSVQKEIRPRVQLEDCPLCNPGFPFDGTKDYSLCLALSRIGMWSEPLMKPCTSPVKTCARRLFAWLAFSCLLFSSSLTDSTAQTRRQATKKAAAIIFVVSGEGEEKWMGPLALVEDGRYKEATGGLEGKDLRPFTNTYLRPGQQYRLLFGGGEAGTVKIKTAQEGCNNITASITVESSVRIGGHVSALATNSETLGRRRPVSRRAPTEAERAAVMELVKNTFRQKQTSAALLRRLETTNLTATDLDGDGEFELIGSFRIDTGEAVRNGARRDLFLIASRAGEGYKAELAHYQSYKLVDGFGGSIDFVDQLDLDGDGIGEVVTVIQGYDAYGYSIYKKQGRLWRRVYSGGGDAC